MSIITPQQESMTLLSCSSLPASPFLMTSAGFVCQNPLHPSDQIQLSISQDLEHFSMVVGISQKGLQSTKLYLGQNGLSPSILSCQPFPHNLVGLVRVLVFQVRETQLGLTKAKNNDKMTNLDLLIWKLRDEMSLTSDTAGFRNSYIVIRL